MKNFILDGRYKDLLQWHGISVEEVLKKSTAPRGCSESPCADDDRRRILPLYAGDRRRYA